MLWGGGWGLAEGFKEISKAISRKVTPVTPKCKKEKVDNTILWTNLYPLDSEIDFPKMYVIYPVTIQNSNNQDLSMR